jgi:hypothetical protein
LSAKEEINRANEHTVDKIFSARPILIDFEIARDVVTDMNEDTILHSGPPVTWDRISGPQKGAVIGALIYEGLVDSPEKAERMVEQREIELSPCHDHQCVGPMAGVISPSMPVAVVENKTDKNRSFSTLNEGLGEVLRFGAYNEKVIKGLKWLEETLYPALKAALDEVDGVDLNSIMARALQMNDECHNRNVAASCLLQRNLLKCMLDSDIDRSILHEVLEFMEANEHFFLNFSMAACKATMDAAGGVKNSTIVTAMTRNGTDFGIRISSLGDEWFTAPAPAVRGLFFSGYNQEDASLDMGDSSIAETRGLGGFAMAASPSIVQFVGGTPSDALNNTREMYEITESKDPTFTIPQLDFQGVPVGIDVRKVLRKGIAPLINTGIAHKDPGVGQIGAGIVRAPMECFKKALQRFIEEIGL